MLYSIEFYAQLYETLLLHPIKAVCVCVCVCARARVPYWLVLKMTEKSTKIAANRLKMTKQANFRFGKLCLIE